MRIINIYEEPSWLKPLGPRGVYYVTTPSGYGHRPGDWVREYKGEYKCIASDYAEDGAEDDHQFLPVLRLVTKQQVADEIFRKYYQTRTNLEMGRRGRS